MTEYGLFSDEGCVERGIWSPAEVRARLTECDPEDDLRLLAMCPDHADDEQPMSGCELCAEEESEQ